MTALVLAAGRSERFGAAKLLAHLGGHPLIRYTVAQVLRANVGEVVVVTGARHEALANALRDLRVRFVQNPRPQDGLSSSLKVGLGAVGDAAALVVLGDQPTVPRAVLQALVAAYRKFDQPIVCPSYRGELGNPVLLSPVLFPELTGLVGDRGARKVIERDPSRVTVVPFSFPMPKDVDTTEDLAVLEAAYADTY